MDESRRQTRSTGAWRHEQSDAQFWSNQPDPLQIERGQAEAIHLVRMAVNPTATTTTTTTVPNSNVTQPSEDVTELNKTDASRVLPMVYVDDKGLEEQFLTGDEASQEVMDNTADRVTTPVDVTPLNLIYTQRLQQDEELDLQPLKGPRDESLGEAIDNFLNDNYEDVLRTSNIQTNFSISDSNRNIPGRPALPLDWIVPDGTNRTLEEIRDKKVANGTSPRGGNTGAMITSLHNLEPYYRTQFFLIDLKTGEVFAFV